MRLISVKGDRGIEWLREGDAWPAGEDLELRARLAESGALSTGRSGGLRIRFVGVIVFNERTLVSLPKVRTAASRMDTHRQVTRAMRQYARWCPNYHEVSPFLNNRPEKGMISGLAAAEWLIDDFNANGLLRRTETSYEMSGNGSTDWRRTVENIDPIMSRGRPVYLETITKRSEQDHRNFATRLHLFLLEKLSAEYGPLLDLEPVLLDHEPIERLQALPSVEECESHLAIEQRRTYSQRGIELLAMMLATVQALEMETANGLALYGTSSFHNVWEQACKSVFSDEVDSWLPHLPKPIWRAADGSKQEQGTFIPDLVAPISDDELFIGDAKYYRLSFSPTLTGNPGVNDVAKQIWYKQHLQDIAQKRGYVVLHNAFLFPSDFEDVQLLGSVELPEGGERVDALALPFLKTLAVYTHDMSSDPGTWRAKVGIVLNDAG